MVSSEGHIASIASLSSFVELESKGLGLYEGDHFY